MELIEYSAFSGPADNTLPRYLPLQPLPTKLALQKKRAKEGRSTDELEQYAVPSRVTVRRGSAVVVREGNVPGGMSASHVSTIVLYI